MGLHEARTRSREIAPKKLQLPFPERLPISLAVTIPHVSTRGAMIP
jgi:hypothetical protein